MKSKAPLALMEQMIMVLVFALAAALCLRVFALSDRLSRESQAQDHAVLLAQNAAEACKASGGDWAFLAQTLGGEALEDGWAARYGASLEAAEPGEAAYRVEVRPAAAEIAGLAAAEVLVYGAEEDLLFRLPVAWQEVAYHG